MTTSMMYEYRARDRSGKVFDGELEATSSAAVANTLRARGMLPLSVGEKKASVLQKELKIPGFGGRIKQKEIALMSRQLATMVNSGLTLIRSLSILEDQSESPALKEIIGKVRTSVEQGVSLSAALDDHPKAFSPLYVSMVRAGEVGGALDETLTRLADTLEAGARLRSQIKSAMAYPVVVLNLIVFIVIAMLVFVVPIFEKMYEDLGGTLPLPTQVLINISRFITSKWWMILAVMAALIYAFKRWKKTEAGRRRWDAMKLRFPVFGQLTQKVAISRFARTFSVLSRTGVPVLQTLDIVAETAGNATVSDAVLEVQGSVKKGESLAQPLERHDVFPPMVTQMMAVGEETGALDAMLGKVADFYDREVEDTVNALTSLIEPILIVVMGVVVGGILISLYLPMFNIANLIQSG
jgi:type IV pilus assembly protein PilC